MSRKEKQTDISPQGINAGMGDVQDAQDPIDHRQPKGDQGIDATDGNSVSELLPEHDQFGVRLPGGQAGSRISFSLRSQSLTCLSRRIISDVY